MSFSWTHRPKSSKDELKPPSNHIQHDPIILSTQYPTLASSATKIRLSLLSTAMVDALGGPPEFHSRFSFPWVDSMIPNENFRLPRGVWTDDTSMTLCLAESLATYRAPGSEQPGGFNLLHQLHLYNRWHQEGYLSAVGRCFDIGATISQALDIFDLNRPENALGLIRRDLSADNFAGNGSLMRILPVGLAYWRDEELARQYGGLSSQATHPTSMCVEACAVWTGAIAKIMQHTTQAASNAPGTAPADRRFSKFDLLKYFSDFPYTNTALQSALALPPNLPPRPQHETETEEWYRRHHPLIRLIDNTQRLPDNHKSKNKDFPYSIPSVLSLPSTGFVLHSLVAALYCFFATKTFEEGALMAVNLGSDADTVGAIYAGLAGCWYAADDAEGIYWTKRVREWHDALRRRDLVERVAGHLVAFEERLGWET